MIKTVIGMRQPETKQEWDDFYTHACRMESEIANNLVYIQHNQEQLRKLRAIMDKFVMDGDEQLAAKRHAVYCALYDEVQSL